MTYTTIGLGGGGAMYCPAILPGDTAVMFVNCDMSGLYRSQDRGYTWRLVDGHDLTAGQRCRVAVHPDDLTVYMYAPYRGLKTSADKGVTWQTVALPSVFANNEPTAIAVDPANAPSSLTTGVFFMGTKNGARRLSYASGAWMLSALPAITGDVVDFAIVRELGATTYRYFCATSDGVYESQNGTTWNDISAGLPAKPMGLFRIRSIAAASSATKLVVYVTAPTVKSGTTWVSGGVYSAVMSAGQPLGGWAETMGAGGTGPLSKAVAGTVCSEAQYEFVAVPRAVPDTVYVTVCGTAAVGGSPEQSGVYKSVDGGATWSHIYDGYQTGTSNVQAGWAEIELGWGFGGPARFPDPATGNSGGFSVCATNPDLILFTDTAFLHITRTGGAPDASLGPCAAASCAWRQGYTGQAAGQGVPAAGQRWSSVGLEVTTTWHYDIDPAASARHFICYTDIGFARSTDRSTTWLHRPPTKRRFGGDRRYNTVYQIAFDPAVPNRVWAACSDQHDIPYKEWLVVRNVGGVARSDDGGVTWAEWSGAVDATTGAPLAGALPEANGANPAASVFGNKLPGPVTTIVLDPASRALWIGIFGSGVFVSSNASTVASAANVTWTDRTHDLPATNLNVVRLQLDTNGFPYCLITAKRTATPSDNSVQQDAYTHETGLWHLAPNNTWTCLTNPFTDQNGTVMTQPWWITDFVVHPSNPQIIYIATAYVDKGASGTNGPAGYPGEVFRTLNGGANWECVLCLKTATPSQPCEVLPRESRDFAQIMKLTLDPDDPSVLYAGTRTHGLWVGANDGTQWSEFWPTLPFMAIHRVAFRWEFWWGWWRGWPPRPWWFWWPWWWWPFRCWSIRRVMYITSFGGGVFRVARRLWWWRCWRWWLPVLQWAPFRRRWPMDLKRELPGWPRPRPPAPLDSRK